MIRAPFAARQILRRSSSSSHAIRIPWKIAANQRTHLIFGANTDVGKTVVSAGLVRAGLAADDNRNVHYIKPLQCGGSDQAFVERHTVIQKQRLTADTLFYWDTPASPHTASRLENHPVSDQQVKDALHESVVAAQQRKSQQPLLTLIETAGGVLSPSSASPANTSPRHASSSSSSSSSSWGWVTQADLYQQTVGQAPVVLVGDGRLGGISATLAALESLVVRGYDIAAVLVIERKGYDNISALKEYVQRPLRLRSGSGEALLSIPSQSVVSLPPIPTDPKELLFDWYEETHEIFLRLDRYLQNTWEGQVADLETLKEEGQQVLWWPDTCYESMESNDPNVTVVDSAAGDTLQVLEKGANHTLESVSLRDTSPQGLAYGDSSMALASAAASGRYGHISFPEVVHAPAVALSQKLLGPRGPGQGWADRVFFTNDRSNAVEVAIKMGIKTYQGRKEVTDRVQDYDWVVCGQEDCYHGDTLGALNAAEPYAEGHHPWYESKALCFETPTLSFRDGVLSVSFPESLQPPDGYTYEFDSVEQAMDVRARMINPRLHSQYKEMIEMQWIVYEHSGVKRRVAACFLEPILMVEGGMKVVDPLWQRALVDIAKSRGVPIIFDETNSGLYRLGVASCQEILQIAPDVGCYSNLLTGGLLPMSVTLASDEVFQTYVDESEALLHNDHFAAHPAGCVSAIQALGAYHALLEGDSGNPLQLFDQKSVGELSRLALVEESFSFGTVLMVRIYGDDEHDGAVTVIQSIVASLREQGILARFQGSAIYLMVSPVTSRDDCSRTLDSIFRTIQSASTR